MALKHGSLGDFWWPGVNNPPARQGTHAAGCATATDACVPGVRALRWEGLRALTRPCAAVNKHSWKNGSFLIIRYEIMP